MFLDGGSSLDADIEVVVPTRKQIDPIVNRRGEGMIMAKDVRPRRPEIRRLGKEPSRNPSAVSGKGKEVETDRIEARTRERTAEAERQPDEQTEEIPVSTFGLSEPSGLHGVVRIASVRSARRRPAATIAASL